MLLYLYIDSIDLQLLNIIDQRSFGTVYTAPWHGSLIVAKVIPVSSSTVCNSLVGYIMVNLYC